MVVLLNLRADCSLLARKTGWSSPHLPPPSGLLKEAHPSPRARKTQNYDIQFCNLHVSEHEITFVNRRHIILDKLEAAKADLKKAMPEDVKEATGHGIKAKRSKSGAVSFEAYTVETSHATIQ